MIQLIFVLLSYAGWANENCNELLQAVHIEIEAARTENRSRFLKGEISKEEYKRIREELFNKQKELGMSSVSQGSSRAVKKKAKPKSEIGIHEVLSFQDLPKPLVDIEYDPSSNLSLFRLERHIKASANGKFKPMSSPDNHLYVAKGEELSDKPIELPAHKRKNGGLLSAIFWPGKNADFRVTIGNLYYYYDFESQQFTGTQLRRSHALKKSHFISHGENWIYNRISGGQGFEVLSVQDPSKHKQQIRFVNDDHSSIYMSPNEEFLISYGPKDFEISYVHGFRTKSVVSFDDVKFEILAAGFTEKSEELLLLSKAGDLRYINLEDLDWSPDIPDILNEPKTSVVKIPGSATGQASFSPDGKTLSVVHATKDEDGDPVKRLTVYNTVAGSIIYDDVAPGGFGDLYIRLKYSSDSQFLILYNALQAKIFRVNSEEADIIK